MGASKQKQVVDLCQKFFADNDIKNGKDLFESGSVGLASKYLLRAIGELVGFKGEDKITDARRRKAKDDLTFDMLPMEANELVGVLTDNEAKDS